MLRTVYLKLHPAFATEAGRAETADLLRSMLALIPEVQGYQIGVPADEASEKAWDLALHVTLAGPAEVEPYLHHPAHQAWIHGIGAERVAFVKAWNFWV